MLNELKIITKILLKEKNHLLDIMTFKLTRKQYGYTNYIMLYNLNMLQKLPYKRRELLNIMS